MRRLLRLALLVATLGALAYVLGKRATPSPTAAPSRPAPRPSTTAAPPVPATPTGGVEPEVAVVGDLDTHGEPDLDTAADRSEHVSDTDAAPAARPAPTKKAAAKKAPAKKATPMKKAAAKKSPAANKAAAKRAVPPVDPDNAG